MNYKNFTIKNFRCFSEKQSLLFAQPIRDKIGSGVTYIVGANNSGKTTLIEAIWMRKDRKIKSSENKNDGSEFCLYDSNGTLKRKASLVRSGSYTLMESPTIDKQEELFEIVTSRRHWDSTTNDTGPSWGFISQSIWGEENPRKRQDIRMAAILKDIEKDNDRYDRFTKLVQRIIPEFTRWAVAYEDQEYIEYTSGDGVKHRTDFLGDGVISVIRILAHIFENKTHGLIIDEPELSLHPLAQKKLIKLIAEYAQNRQIILSTHSPYFVSWEYIKNGAVLIDICQ